MREGACLPFFLFFFLRKEIINYCATKSCNLLSNHRWGLYVRCWLTTQISSINIEKVLHSLSLKIRIVKVWKMFSGYCIPF